MQSTLENWLQLENLNKNTEFKNKVNKEINSKAVYTASTLAAYRYTN
jgi:hypothetical protein